MHIEEDESGAPLQRCAIPSLALQGAAVEGGDAIRCLGTYDSVLQQVYELPLHPQRRKCWQPGLFSSAVKMFRLAQRLLGLFPRVYEGPGASYSIICMSDLGLPILL